LCLVSLAPQVEQHIARAAVETPHRAIARAAGQVGDAAEVEHRDVLAGSANSAA
jgi:hypothetical protein